MQPARFALTRSPTPPIPWPLLLTLSEFRPNHTYPTFRRNALPGPKSSRKRVSVQPMTPGLFFRKNFASIADLAVFAMS